MHHRSPHPTAKPQTSWHPDFPLLMHRLDEHSVHIHELRGDVRELKTSIGAVRIESRDQVDALRKDSQQQFDTFRRESQQQLDAFRRETQQSLQEMRAEIASTVHSWLRSASASTR